MRCEAALPGGRPVLPVGQASLHGVGFATYSQRKMKEAPITGALAACLKGNDYQNL
jgi:hypothetical protein